MKTNTPYNFVASFIEQNREHTFIGLMEKKSATDHYLGTKFQESELIF